MEKEGVVSIWVGNIDDSELLFKYIDLSYEVDENDEYIPSQFMKDFKVDMDDIDEDFIERVRYDVDENNLNELFKMSSYSDILTPNITGLIGSILDEKVNSKILIYNYLYSQEVKHIKGEGYDFKYCGCVSYIR